MDDFQAASDRFLEWFKSVGGQFREDLLQIVDLRHRGAGRGIGEHQWHSSESPGACSTCGHLILTAQLV